MKAIHITLLEDNKATLAVDGNINFPEASAAITSALLALMQQTVSRAEAHGINKEHLAALKKEIYDRVNCSISTILLEFAPEIEAHPDFTAQAMLEAENKFLDSKVDG